MEISRPVYECDLMTIRDLVSQEWISPNGHTQEVSRAAFQLSRIYGGFKWFSPEMLSEVIALTCNTSLSCASIQATIIEIHNAILRMYPIVQFFFEKSWLEFMDLNDANDARERALNQLECIVWNPAIPQKVMAIAKTIRFAPVGAIRNTHKTITYIEDLDQALDLPEPPHGQTKSKLLDRNGNPVFEGVPLGIVPAMIHALDDIEMEIAVLGKLGFFLPAVSSQQVFELLGIQRSENFYQRLVREAAARLELMQQTVFPLQTIDFITLINEVVQAILPLSDIRCGTYGFHLYRLLSQLRTSDGTIVHPHMPFLSENERLVVDTMASTTQPRNALMLAQQLGMLPKDVVYYQRQALQKLTQETDPSLLYTRTGRLLTDGVRTQLLSLIPNPYLLGGLTPKQRQIYDFLTAREGDIVTYSYETIARDLNSDPSSVLDSAKAILSHLQRDPNTVFISTVGEIDPTSARGKVIRQFQDDPTWISKLPERYGRIATLVSSRKPNGQFYSEQELTEQLNMTKASITASLRKINNVIEYLRSHSDVFYTPNDCILKDPVRLQLLAIIPDPYLLASLTPFQSKVYALLTEKKGMFLSHSFETVAQALDTDSSIVNKTAKSVLHKLQRDPQSVFITSTGKIHPDSPRGCIIRQTRADPSWVRALPPQYKKTASLASRRKPNGQYLSNEELANKLKISRFVLKSTLRKISKLVNT
jgi:biotin operon repressor